MAAPTEVPRVPCSHCRSEIVVMAQYAHGDHIMGDVVPLKEIPLLLCVAG